MKKLALIFWAVFFGTLLQAQRSALEIGATTVSSEPDVKGLGIGVLYAYQLNKWFEVGAGITSSHAYDERGVEFLEQRFLQNYLTGRLYMSLIPIRIDSKYFLRLGAAYNFTQERKVWLITNIEGQEILEEAVNQWDWLGGSVHAGIGWNISEKWTLEARSNLGGYANARLIGDWGIFVRLHL